MTMTQYPLLALIPLLPLLGAAYNAFVGARMQKRFGYAAVHVPAILMPGISFVITVLAFARLVSLPHHERVLTTTLWSWMPVGSVDAGVAFLMDPLALVMCGFITFVGTLIHIYSVGYMHEEPSYWRFFSYLNLFMFAMLVLVLADNFILMFVGWEGVGLCSYLLISFWYKEKKNAVAGMKAFIVNRIGDFGFLLGLLLLFWSIHGVTGGSSVVFRNIEEILAQPAVREALSSQTVLGLSLISMIGILFFVGAMGKSAQIPLYVWLPDAMAGPTPVSALIHAATMVTAGVYLVARLHFVFALSPLVMSWVALVGAVTAVFAATIGFFQHDIKKVLAYSTVSQLGYMFIGVGVGAYWVAIFHVMTHAFFKACLFLGSGSVILGCHHEQDMRRMGGLKKFMPVTAWTYFIACCAIAGFPFTSGFFSKDEILWKAFDSGNLLFPGGGLMIWALGALGAVCTAFYMFRSYYMTFTGEYRGAHGHNGHGGHQPHESPRNMTHVLVVLAAFSLVAGFIGLPHLWHLPSYLHHWLDPVFSGSAEIIRSAGHGSGHEWALMIFSVALALTGWAFARWLYRDNRNAAPSRLIESKHPLVCGIHRLVYNKYYVDEIYDAVFVGFVMWFRKICDWIDRNIVDALVNFAGLFGRLVGRVHGLTDTHVVDGAVNGTAWSIASMGSALRLVQTGNLRTYLYIAISGAIALVIMNFILFG